MGRHFAMCRFLGLLIFALPMGCSQTTGTRDVGGIPVVRVRVLENIQQVTIAASTKPIIQFTSDKSTKQLNLEGGASTNIALAPTGAWRVGDLTLGGGEMHIVPQREGSVSVNGTSYRGNYRLVPIGGGAFDVVNDVDLEGYLKSVLPKELPALWDINTYKAQAIVARTYALFVTKTASQARHFDLHNDQRSQVYGGLGVETSKSREAVDTTRGIVVAFGAPGKEKIFKAYFSSCCGGITQSAADAFGDSYIPPLSDQDVQSLCNASTRFSWGPVVIRKDELTRRLRLFGARRDRPEKDLATIAQVDVLQTNRYGRPVRFVVTDVRGQRYSLSGEELRWAVNTDAAQGSTLYSSFVKTINDPDVVRFVDGHGWGHGVGMCQWCAQRRAELTMSPEDIVLTAFQRSVLRKAY